MRKYATWNNSALWRNINHFSAPVTHSIDSYPTLLVSSTLNRDPRKNSQQLFWRSYWGKKERTGEAPGTPGIPSKYRSSWRKRQIHRRYRCLWQTSRGHATSRTAGRTAETNEILVKLANTSLTLEQYDWTLIPHHLMGPLALASLSWRNSTHRLHRSLWLTLNTKSHWCERKPGTMVTKPLWVQIWCLPSPRSETSSCWRPFFSWIWWFWTSTIGWQYSGPVSPTSTGHLNQIHRSAIGWRVLEEADASVDIPGLHMIFQNFGWLIRDASINVALQKLVQKLHKGNFSTFLTIQCSPNALDKGMCMTHSATITIGAIWSKIITT